MPDPETPPPKGTPFAGGRYLLIRELGRGGTAAVYLATDSRNGKLLAIKVLAPKYAARELLRQRFRRESESMAQITHPNVLRVKTWGIAEGSMFLVTEWGPGGSIGAWVRKHGPMPPLLATTLILQVCDGVGAAHAMNIVHRDVKPDNVLMSADGTVRVCDFGIAQVRVLDEDPLTRTGTSIGTLGFMAPEQSDEARDVDVRADVYSIAATLWYLLRGRVPPHAFQADPWENGIPGPLCPALGRATAYRREDRQDTVQAFADEIRAAIPRLPADPPDTPPLVPPGVTDNVVPEWMMSAATEAASDEPETTWVDPE